MTREQVMAHSEYGIRGYSSLTPEQQTHLKQCLKKRKLLKRQLKSNTKSKSVKSH